MWHDLIWLAVAIVVLCIIGSGVGAYLRSLARHYASVDGEDRGSALS